MANSLLKTIAHNSIADAIYKEITTRSSRFYHSFGKTSLWINEISGSPSTATPDQPVDSKPYEREVRNEIIAMKEISPSDVSYVILYREWTSGTVYDKYDDYSSVIQGINITNPGSYTSAPAITIGDIVPTSTSVTLNSQYYYNGYLYTVTTAGTTTTSNAGLGTVLNTAYTHGSAVLTCVGIQATATASLGTVSGDTTKIVSITMVNKGYGYTTIPTVSVGTTYGSGGTVNAVIAKSYSGSQSLENSTYYVYNNNNIYICVDNNNNSASTVAPTGTSSSIITTEAGYKWKYMSTVPTNSKFLTLNSWLPVYTSSKDQYSASGSITGITVDNGGSGYTSASVSITGDGTSATAVPAITNGIITGITITNAGSGYSYANVSITSSSGSGASASASIFNPALYNSTQSLSEASCVAGQILSIPVITGGYGYTSATVSISGDGTGATATATCSGGKVTYITITNHGTGYNWATVSITGVGSGSNPYGASARAVIAPFGGLGKDPVNQLCARSLMFYSNIQNNKIQDITVSNDYRQVAIIKDPVRYNAAYYLTANFATTCWKVVAVSNTTSITTDDVITTTYGSVTYRFRVEYVSGTNFLLIPLDNGIPSAGMQFVKGTDTFTVSSVIAPTVNKYSGDLMYIDNEKSFSGASTVLRTVINF